MCIGCKLIYHVLYLVLGQVAIFNAIKNNLQQLEDILYSKVSSLQLYFVKVFIF